MHDMTSASPNSIFALAPSRRSPVFPFFIFILVLFLCPPLFAGAALPTQLPKPSREEVLKQIGLSSSTKLLSDPYPLGGFKGIEVGVSVETISFDEVRGLGGQSANVSSEVIVPKLSFGKGLYNNLDLFMSFVPYSESTRVSQFGGIARWGFYEGEFVPFTLSALIHGTSTNFNNQLVSRSLGLDLVAGLNANSLGVYLGGGPIQATGSFLGGTSGVTDTGLTENDRIEGFHFVAGLASHLGQLFLAIELDQYYQTVVSGKMGLRF